jgi:hypothetical protein
MTCGGEKCAFRPGLKSLFATMALEGTRAAWSPVPDERTRTAIRAAERDMVRTLTQSGTRFQTGLAIACWLDLFMGASAAFPRGAVLYGEVRDSIDGPDGKYFVLAPENARANVLVRADCLAELSSKGAAKEWSPGMQVLLLGAAMGRCKLPSGEDAVSVLPFDWAPVGLGIAVPDDGDSRRPPPKGRR